MLLVAALKYRDLFVRHHASTKWVPFCIVCCTFRVVTLHVALYIALLEHTTENIQYIELLLPQNETEDYIIGLIVMIVR